MTKKINLSDIKNQISLAESKIPPNVLKKMQLVYRRLELHEKTQVKISQKSNVYSGNLRKIYIHLVRISNLWAVYEGIFDLLENYIGSDIFLKKTGKGKLVSGYLDNFSKKTAIKYSTTIQFESFFESILERSKKFPHLDGLKFIKTIEDYIKYLIEENSRVRQETNNNLLNSVVNKLNSTYNLKIKNYRKRTNFNVLEKNINELKWSEFLALVYSIRNHFYHNLQTGSESIEDKKSEKFKLVFLLNIYVMHYEIVLNLYFNEIDKYLKKLQQWHIALLKQKN